MSRRFTRRELLRLGGLGSAMALLAACQAKVVEKIVEKEVTKVVKEVVKETEIVKEVVKETVIVAGTPQVVEKEVTRVVEKEVAAPVEQVLRICLGTEGVAEQFHFNCLVAGGAVQDWMPLLYTPPMYFDVDLNHKFGVFDSCESNDDKTVWTFHINPKAVFSDGSPITAADVKGTWEIQTEPMNAVGRAKAYLGNTVGFAEAREEGGEAEVSGFKVVDEHTIEVSLVNSDPLFHWLISTCHLPTIKVAQYKQYDWDTYWLPENNPVFSGPFLLKSYDPDYLTAEMVRNPNWWMDEGPYLDRMLFTFVADAQTRGAIFRNEQADVVVSLPEDLKEEYPDVFVPMKLFGFNLFWMNPNAPPTDDLNVRKALTLSVDWEQVFAAAFPLGDAIPTPNLIDPDIPCQDKERVWYEYDLEAAKAALAASEYGSAENLPKLRVTPRGTNPEWVNALEAMMGFWRENLGITNVEWKQQPAEWTEEDQVLINLSRDDVSARFPDAATYMWKAAHSEGPVASGGLLGGYVNEKIDALLDEALAIDPDDPRRCELALEAQRLFMDDYVTLTWGDAASYFTRSEYVKNWYRGPDMGVIEPWKIKIEK
ncbi:MAG TPA: ABC transporter substrate-binding protein [Anaerolineae bacterium]|nr:ABC transporter substrate-binding protein [Anaerolineae bacterium]